jgi:hypothetical protein
MERELAQLVSIRDFRPRNRWYGSGVSLCLARIGAIAPPKRAVNWNKVLGLLTVLVVVALGWTTVGIAVSHFLR